MENDEHETGGFDPMQDAEERAHLLSVLDSFRSYRRLAHFNGTHVRRQAFYSLPSSHWTLLSQPPFSILDNFNKLDDLISSNAALAEAIFCAGFKGFIAPSLDAEWVATIVDEKHAHDELKVYETVLDALDGGKATPTDLEKARSCIHQFYREWSAEGAVERDKCFTPILDTLNAEWTSRSSSGATKSDFHVLVPGAGLGRLVFDICCAGFSAQGNEISYHELMASSLVLNGTERARQFTIAPFALNGSNHLSRDDQFRTFGVPDVHPATALSGPIAAGEGSVEEPGEMSMVTGDFCVLYSDKNGEFAGMFDAVATVFFIDTAPNVIRYIETVRNCLKAGGLWINLGPLLWHHASRSHHSGEDKDKLEKEGGKDQGIADPGSVELTNEEVIALVEHLGFRIEKHKPRGLETGYISNERSMLRSIYTPSFWVARKL
ncbi:methyltransferas-like protein [Aaosphaeria arxii CBS 175.79]|uniref:carnosine N-methyltransferase n=1 Tax=Aaosphaeria arxii CBS 175.79 TaxID=1450172 RepID=A0A6A5XEE6_9PLEO|nr:methyltransferas-like protein [Aaosphaeria arxii CBS 175.79]KAF2011167.1 methyltransferas-like protein [Aaosphaeria arxii CBS 175.79]